MIFESPLIWFIGTIIMFISFILMRLKKNSIIKCLVVEICLFSIIYYIATSIFPLYFINSSESYATIMICDSFIPLSNILNSKLSISDPQGFTTYYWGYVYTFIKTLILDFAIGTIVSASIYYFKRRTLTTLINSLAITYCLIIIKIIFICLNISQFSLYDTMEFIILGIGCFCGISCMKYIIEYSSRKEKNE